MSTFFTSDTHFHHTNIIKYCNRPFASAAEMNESLINNWNSVVSAADTVYHLGDLSFGDLDFVSGLNGNIVLVCGNHDNRERIESRFGASGKIKTLNDFRGKIEGQYMHLYHYPMESWDRGFHGSWHLHGHIHSSGSLPTTRRRYDVGVDNNNYRPIGIDQLRDIFAKIGEAKT